LHFKPLEFDTFKAIVTQFLLKVNTKFIFQSQTWQTPLGFLANRDFRELLLFPLCPHIRAVSQSVGFPLFVRKIANKDKR